MTECLQPVAQAGEARRFSGISFAAEVAGFAETHDAGNVERAGAQAGFVAAAIDLGGHSTRADPAANVERADALGSVQLVRGEGEQIDGVALDVDGDFAEGLRGIAMKEDTAFAAERSDFGHRLQDADFVIGGHHAHQHGIGSEGGAQAVEARAGHRVREAVP